MYLLIDKLIYHYIIRMPSPKNYFSKEEIERIRKLWRTEWELERHENYQIHSDEYWCVNALDENRRLNNKSVLLNNASQKNINKSPTRET